MTTVAVPRETRPGERRVALVPEQVARLVGAGLEVTVEANAGAGAFITDAEFAAVGARVVSGSVLGAGDVVTSVNSLSVEQIQRLGSDAIALSFLAPSTSLDKVAAARDAGVTYLSMELVPRISRAQSMDALSSQALVSGYRCALVAAEHLPKFFPLLMTAAGTIKPAQVVVLGAGVAGLQAIATAKRLGAVVQAYDVRAAAADEIRSVGAKFIDLELDTLEGAGGYAREMTEERSALQRDRLAPFIAKADALITTAAVPGRQAPLLVTREMVEAMAPGSIVVDLAAETGGNVEGSKPGELVAFGPVAVWGGLNVPSQLPVAASRLYAANVTNLLLLMTTDGSVGLDLDDEIVDGAAVTHAGVVRFGPAREALQKEDA